MTEAAGNVPAPSERPGRHLGGIAIAAVCVLAAAALYLHDHHGQIYPQPAPAPAPAVTSTAARPAPPRAAPVQRQPTAPAALAANAPAANPAAPSVDVVRVDQNGALVMAGQAAPGERLTIRNGDTTLGTVTTDDNGQWVFLPDASLPSGVHQLSVSGPAARAGETAPRTTVLLSLPGGAAAGGQSPGPLVVLSQGNAPPRLLEGPAGHSGPVGLDVVQYDGTGQIRFTGHAQPGHTVRLYVNNKPVGDALADARGAWSMTPGQDLRAGLYELRTDELAPSGKVIARTEVPFARANLQSLAAGQDVVQPGDCLWTIARHNYGHGVEYTAIFVKNMDQIRDPDRIYPGQVFRMPSADEATRAPSVSTIRRLKQGETSRG